MTFDAAIGDFVREYRRDQPEYVTAYVATLATNRNIAIYGRDVIDTSLGHRPGTPILDYARNLARHWSGPIIVGGKVRPQTARRRSRPPETCGNASAR